MLYKQTLLLKWTFLKVDTTTRADTLVKWTWLSYWVRFTCNFTSLFVIEFSLSSRSSVDRAPLCVREVMGSISVRDSDFLSHTRHVDHFTFHISFFTRPKIHHLYSLTCFVFNLILWITSTVEPPLMPPIYKGHIHSYFNLSTIACSPWLQRPLKLVQTVK